MDSTLEALQTLKLALQSGALGESVCSPPCASLRKIVILVSNTEKPATCRSSFLMCQKSLPGGFSRSQLLLVRYSLNLWASFEARCHASMVCRIVAMPARHYGCLGKYYANTVQAASGRGVHHAYI